MSRSYSSGLSKARLTHAGQTRPQCCPALPPLLTEKQQFPGRDLLAAVAPLRGAPDWYFHTRRSLFRLKTSCKAPTIVIYVKGRGGRNPRDPAERCANTGPTPVKVNPHGSFSSYHGFAHLRRHKPEVFFFVRFQPGKRAAGPERNSGSQSAGHPGPEGHTVRPPGCPPQGTAEPRIGSSTEPRVLREDHGRAGSVPAVCHSPGGLRRRERRTNARCYQ